MRRSSAILLVSFLLAVTPAARGGDPVPDVDVILEQIPGLALRMDTSWGSAFDEVTFTLPRVAARGVRPADLPAGWTMTRDGRNVTLAGPAVTPPVRLRLALAEGEPAPRELSYRVLLGGEVLLRRDDVVPALVAGPQARGSLQGEVHLPEKVSPGETLVFRASQGADLPAGGRFVLSGVVTEPFPEEEWHDVPFAIVNTTRSHLKTRAAALPADFELQGAPGDCADLAPVAAVLAVAGGLGAGGTIPLTAAPRDTAGSVWAVDDLGSLARERSPLSSASKTRHDPAMSTIRNIRGIIAVAPAGPGGGAAGRGGAAVSRPASHADFAVEEGGVRSWRAAAAGAAPTTIAWAPATRPLPLDGEGVELVALSGEPTADGCRFAPRVPSWAEMAAAASHPPRGGRDETQKPPPATAAGALGGTVYAVDLPDDLPPGGALSLQYIDLYGDVWLDVPAVPGVEVVPPASPEGGEEVVPCLHAATRYVQTGDLLCVCGSFPTPQAWQSLSLSDRPLGAPVAASSRSVRLRVPAGTPLGRQVVAGPPAAGYTAECRTTTDVVAIAGELDSQSLLRGDSTPLRITVSGTTDPLPLRVRNLSPQVIEIEGGPDQHTETSGGAANTLTRQVHGLTRGDFNLDWTVELPECPCEEAAATGPSR